MIAMNAKTCKRTITLTSILLLVGLFAAANGFAHQGSRQGNGWSSGSTYNRLYEPTTVETLCGVVTLIEHITPMRGMADGIHVMLKTETETVSVHLGPAWYLENQDTQIQEADTLEVLGSRITFAGKPAILAAAVRRGDEGLHLRDEDGIPAWSGWRRLR